MKIYCFGNEFLENDSLAKQLADEIVMPEIEFIKCNSPEEIFLEKEDITILDVVAGINQVILINDLGQLKSSNIYTLHDFDLSFFLKLMKAMDRIRGVSIIGIPMKGDKEEIKKEILQKIADIKSS